MILKELEAIGLTRGEIKVYMALLTLKDSSTGPIANESGVSRSKLYNILDKLSKKGLVIQYNREKVAYFKAMRPNRILDYFDEKSESFSKQRAQIKSLLPQLELLSASKTTGTAVTLYKGFKAIKNYYNSLLDDMKKGEIYYVIGATYPPKRPDVRAFFQNYHTRRAKKGIYVHMLANNDVRNSLVPATKHHSQIRHLPQYLLTNMTILIYKNKSFIFFSTDDPIGFLIESSDVAKGFRTYFDTFWKIAKK